MKLADKIILLRKKFGYSQEELAELLNVSRQSVSKWEGAQSIPDLNKILKMSSIFGVSTDYLLKDEIEDEIKEELKEDNDNYVMRQVSLQEASNFLEENIQYAKETALAVSLCILSPVMMMFLLGLQNMNIYDFSEDKAGIIGSIILLLIISIAVGIFIKNNMKMKKYEFLEKVDIETEYGVKGLAKDKREMYSNTHTNKMILGVVLCISSSISVLGAAVYNQEHLMLFSVCILLILVSIGVNKIVNTSIIWGGFEKLLEEGDFTRVNKEVKRSPIMGIYWIIVVAIYLGYSFITYNWAMSWIIWPIAGILSGIIYEIRKLRK